MGTFKELVEDAKLMHDLERRWVNRVTAEITQEVGVLFKYEHIHAHARKE
jgi:hypothetical protein